MVKANWFSVSVDLWGSCIVSSFVQETTQVESPSACTPPQKKKFRDFVNGKLQVSVYSDCYWDTNVGLELVTKQIALLFYLIWSAEGERASLIKLFLLVGELVGNCHVWNKESKILRLSTAHDYFDVLSYLWNVGKLILKKISMKGTGENVTWRLLKNGLPNSSRTTFHSLNVLYSTAVFV